MNADLVENSVKYHGKELLDLILKQNNCALSASNDREEENFKTTNPMFEIFFQI